MFFCGLVTCWLHGGYKDRSHCGGWTRNILRIFEAREVLDVAKKMYQCFAENEEAHKNAEFGHVVV